MLNSIFWKYISKFNNSTQRYAWAHWLWYNKTCKHSKACFASPQLNALHDSLQPGLSFGAFSLFILWGCDCMGLYWYFNYQYSRGGPRCSCFPCAVTTLTAAINWFCYMLLWGFRSIIGGKRRHNHNSLSLSSSPLISFSRIFTSPWHLFLHCSLHCFIMTYLQACCMSCYLND